MTATRTLTLTYGATTIDGSGGVHLHGDPPVRWVKGWSSGQLDATVVVTAATAAALTTAVLALIDAFRTPRQDLVLTRSGTVELDARVSTGAAFDTDANLSKVGSPFDSGRSQLLALSVKFGLPADKASLDGRREATVSVEYDGSRRRRVTLSGVYTSITSTAATAKYTANVGAWASARLAEVGGTYSLEGESKQWFETDHELAFVRIYREILTAEAGHASTDDPDIAEQTFSLSVETVAPGDSVPLGVTVTRLQRATVSYSAAVPGGVAVLDAVAARVLAWLDVRVAAALPGVGLARLASAVDKDYAASRIAVRQTWECAVTTGWAEYSRTEQTRYDSGLVIRKKWSPNPWDRYIWRRPPTMMVTVSEVGLWVGVYPANPFLGTLPVVAPPGGTLWFLADVATSALPQRRGPSDARFDVVLVSRVSSYEAAAFSLDAQGPK